MTQAVPAPPRTVPPTVFDDIDDVAGDVPHEPPTEPFEPLAPLPAKPAFDADATQGMRSNRSVNPDVAVERPAQSPRATIEAPVPLTPPRVAPPPMPPQPVVRDEPAAARSIAPAAHAAAAVPSVVPAAPPLVAAPFRGPRFHFTGGVPTGQTAQVRDDAGATLLTYGGFASVIGIVAALMSGIVLVAGTASVLFLVAEARPLPALLTLVLSICFAAGIAMLVPRTTVTLYDANGPALTIRQASQFTFPVARFLVVTPDGKTLAMLRKNFLSRLARHHWTIDAGDGHGRAIEESLSRAMIRKLLGKFNRRHDADILIDFRGAAVATIIRRPNGRGEVDMLDVHSNAIDPRVLVALATLVYGAEP